MPLKGGGTIFNISTLGPTAIEICGKIFFFFKIGLNIFPETTFFFIFFRFEILLHFDVPDNQILLHFGVPDNKILLHLGVADNWSMNISS